MQVTKSEFDELVKETTKSIRNIFYGSLEEQVRLRMERFYGSGVLDIPKGGIDFKANIVYNELMFETALSGIQRKNEHKNIEDINDIMIEATQFKDRHGGFVYQFAVAWQKADTANRRVLMPVALELIRKYPELKHSKFWEDDRERKMMTRIDSEFPTGTLEYKLESMLGCNILQEINTVYKNTKLAGERIATVLDFCRKNGMIASMPNEKFLNLELFKPEYASLIECDLVHDSEKWIVQNLKTTGVEGAYSREIKPDV